MCRLADRLARKYEGSRTDRDGVKIEGVKCAVPKEAERQPLAGAEKFHG